MIIHFEVVTRDNKKLFRANLPGPEQLFPALPAEAWDYISFRDNSWREKIKIYRNGILFDKAEIYCYRQEPMSFSGFPNIVGERPCFETLPAEELLEDDIIECISSLGKPTDSLDRLVLEITKRTTLAT